MFSRRLSIRATSIGTALAMASIAYAQPPCDKGESSMPIQKRPAPSEGRAMDENLPEYASEGLGGYMVYMSEKIGFYYAVEDRPGPTGAVPWVESLDDFERDFEIQTIDALVTYLNDELEGVKAIRSTKIPQVVHLIAEDLLVEGYAMDRNVAIQNFSGKLDSLPAHIGTLLDGKVGGTGGGGIPPRPPYGDFTTEIEIANQNGSVRDVLTKAVPLQGYSRLIWGAAAVDGTSRVGVEYGGPEQVEEEPNALPAASPGQ